MSYCAIGDVQALNTTRDTYSASTNPSSTQVGTFITNIAAEIDAALAANRVLTPVTAPASFLTFLLHLNALGAAALAEEAAFPEFDGGPGTTTQGQRYYKQYQDGLKGLKDGSLIDPSAATASTSTLARTYQTDNPANDPTNDGTSPNHQPLFSMSKEF